MPTALESINFNVQRKDYSQGRVYFHLEPTCTRQVVEDLLVHRLVATINLWQDTMGPSRAWPDETRVLVKHTVSGYFRSLLEAPQSDQHKAHGTRSVLEQALHEEWNDVMSSLKLEGKVAYSGSTKKHVFFDPAQKAPYIRHLTQSLNYLLHN